jgi:hypothetical protein
MEFLNGLKDVWLQYYPVILSVGTVVTVFAAGIYGVYSQIRPILDKLNAIKDKVVNVDKEDITTKLQSLDLQTKITDLKAKIANPTISDELKQQYISQLATTEVLFAKINAGLVIVTETASKF